MCIAVMMAAPSFAIFGGGKDKCGPAWWAERPVFAPAPCLPYPVPKKVIKKWEARIVAPAPCGPVGGWGWGGCGTGKLLGAFPNAGLLGSALPGLIGTPLDFLFNGTDSVYGCMNKKGGSACGFGPCVSGPVPAILFGVPHVFLSQPITVFGGIF